MVKVLSQSIPTNTPDDNMVLITGINTSPTVKTFCIVTFDQAQARYMRSNGTKHETAGVAARCTIQCF